MRAIQRTTHREFGSSTCERVSNATQHDVASRNDSAAHLGAPELHNALRLALAPPTPALQRLPIAHAPTAALVQLHTPLLQAWWQAAYIALGNKVLTHQEILDEDFTAMQRVIGLAMLEGMLRRWLSGCGPCGGLTLPNTALMPAEAVQAVRDIHRTVITRPTYERDVLITRFAQLARQHIVAGSIDDATLARVASAQAPMAERLAVQLFYATTASALTARTTQTVLLGVFWNMLAGFVEARAQDVRF